MLPHLISYTFGTFAFTNRVKSRIRCGSTLVLSGGPPAAAFGSRTMRDPVVEAAVRGFRRSIIPAAGETGREALRQSQTWNPRRTASESLRAPSPCWLNVTGVNQANGSCSSAQTFRMFTLPLIQTLACVFTCRRSNNLHI